jgi:dihydropteroate synthase
MGILNITPDSFYDGGKFNDESNRKSAVEKMLADVASLIDIGAASSRPGAAVVQPEEEWKRLAPVFQLMRDHFPETIFSVDTMHASTARKALESGASIINDITSGRDPEMISTVSEYAGVYIMMHMQGTPADMQHNPQYTDVTREILDFFIERLSLARSAGLEVIADPGFGFGKTTEHNYRLLRDLSAFRAVLNVPVLAGVSRKSMINKPLSINAVDALNGTTVINTIALLNGASVLRVHDVKEAVQAVKLVNLYRNI